MKSDLDALVYILDATLCTVEIMAEKRARSKNEYLRQKTIAQEIINHLFAMRHVQRDGEGFITSPEIYGSKYWSGNRFQEALEKYSGNVHKWAQQFEPVLRK